MIRTILAAAWLAVTLAALFLGLNGTLEPAAMVAFSLTALALFYAFALWSVIMDPGGSRRPGLN